MLKCFVYSSLQKFGNTGGFLARLTGRLTGKRVPSIFAITLVRVIAFSILKHHSIGKEMNYHRGYFQITVTYSLGGKRQVLSLETKSFPSYDSMLMESYLKNHNKFKNNDIALKLAQFVGDIVFYIHAKFQRKIIICKIVMIFFLTAQ